MTEESIVGSFPTGLSAFCPPWDSKEVIRRRHLKRVRRGSTQHGLI